MINISYQSADGLLLWQDNYPQAPLQVVPRHTLEYVRTQRDGDPMCYLLACLAVEVAELQATVKALAPLGAPR